MSVWRPRTAMCRAPSSSPARRSRTAVETAATLRTPDSLPRGGCGGLRRRLGRGGRWLGSLRAGGRGLGRPRRGRGAVRGLRLRLAAPLGGLLAGLVGRLGRGRRGGGRNGRQRGGRGG